MTWQEQFDKKFGQGKAGSQEMLLRDNIKDFISNLLQSQRLELIKEIEGMKKVPELVGVAPNAKDHAYNKALTEANELLKKKQ
jgi:hypothetical protein